LFHYVCLYRLREGVRADQVRAARESLAALVETLPGVVQFAVVDNFAAAGGGYRLALITAFESRAAYEIFQRHDAARQVFDRMLGPIVDAPLVVEGESP
jgi:hypothetical protein